MLIPCWRSGTSMLPLGRSIDGVGAAAPVSEAAGAPPSRLPPLPGAVGPPMSGSATPGRRGCTPPPPYGARMLELVGASPSFLWRRSL